MRLWFAFPLFVLMFSSVWQERVYGPDSARGEEYEAVAEGGIGVPPHWMEGGIGVPPH